MRAFLDFLKDETASAAVETGLITSLLGVACVTALSDLGEQLATVFNYITAVLAAAIGGGYA